MRYFFDLIFALFMLLALPKAIRRSLKNSEYRGMFGRRWRCPIRKDDRKVIWINGVSVGEISSAQSLVDQIRERWPSKRIVVSATTGTGYRRACELYGKKAEVIGYPFDFHWVVSSFLKKINPQVVIMLELDLWPNFLLSCSEREVPIMVVNGRLSQGSTEGYLKIKGLLHEPFLAITAFLAQDEVDAERAKRIGMPEHVVQVGGNMKFDLIRTARCDSPYEHWRDKCNLVLASTHEPEEMALLQALQEKLPGNWRLILVPRHPERCKSLERRLHTAGYNFTFFSSLSEEKQVPDHVLVDKIGILADLYAIADLVLIGGTLIAHGGQNMIEPAALGIPVVVGPSTGNFREAMQILRQNSGICEVSNVAGATEALLDLINNPDKGLIMGKKARDAVASRQGASKYAANGLASLLNEE